MSDGLKYNLKFYLAWVLDEVCPQKDLLFIIVDWSAKVESSEIRGVTGKFILGVQNEAW